MNRRGFISYAAVASVMIASPAIGASSGTQGSSRAHSLDVEPNLPAVLSVDYTSRDYEIIDYQFYTLPAMPRIRFRGPRFDPLAAAPGSFFTALGSAHTLGVLSQTTYCNLLADKIGLSAWNAGAGGISPSFYLKHPEIIEYANRGKFVILQVMSARLDSNDRIESTAAAQLVVDKMYGDIISPEVAWSRISEEEPENRAKYIAQSQAAWARNYRALIDSFQVPVILFWFSARDFNEVLDNSANQTGSTSAKSFPQYIDGNNVERITGSASDLSVCVTDKNAGHPLVNRFTGEPQRINHRDLDAGRGPGFDFYEDRNHYYPSPEMHEDAARCLLDTLKKLKLAK